MKNLLLKAQAFFFRPVSAQGFGLMRIAWAYTILRFMTVQIGDVSFLYSDKGLLPPEYMHLFVSEYFRWNLLDFIQNPLGVNLIFAAFLISTFLMLIGLHARISTMLSVFLFMCFAERAMFTSSGGQMVMRAMGFFLVISPNISAFSVDRLRLQWSQWMKNRTLLGTPTMSIWAFRLVLAQLMVIYLFTLLEKILGPAWWQGLTPGVSLHHRHFARFPLWMMDYLSPLSPFIAGYTLAYDLGWAVLLIPATMIKKLTKGHLRWETMKRFLLLTGCAFHGGILFLMDVAMFSHAMFVSFCGILLAEDFKAMRHTVNYKWKGKKIHILYDDKCKLCRRTAFTLLILDHLHRLDLVNFHHEAKRKKVDSSLAFEDLDKAMHIKLPDGKVLKGFDAMRELTKHLPLLWPVHPLLYIPHIEDAGHKVYAYIAGRRKRCTDDSCEL